MPEPIDLLHQGFDRVIGAYDVGGVVVDPGPASCVERLLERCGQPRALLLTHIHLDHAGATGVLVRRFPELRVYVHERGARHLVDPEKLIKSARQLYGDDMDRLWGEIAPVPAGNIHELSGGETVEGFRVMYTPGHASHHVSYLDEHTGDAYVGDTAGVRVPPSDRVLAPTPPPDIDLEAWRESVAAIETWSPTALCLTHFGRVTDVSGHLDRFKDALGRQAELARSMRQDDFIETLRGELDVEEDVAQRLERAAPFDHVFLGLERYWRKRAEREAA